MQQPDTQQTNDSRMETYLWIAGVAGVAVGIAALATKHRETAWEKARRRTLEAAAQAAQTARKQVKPWMGVAAGAAVSGAGLAYKMRRQPSGWQLAQKNAAQLAGKYNDAVQPWMKTAAAAALSAIALARSNKKQRSAAGAIMDNASETADKLAETGARILRRVQQISGETRKLYPSVKRLIA